MTRGQLPQRTESPGLNGSGAAAAVPPKHDIEAAAFNITRRRHTDLTTLAGDSTEVDTVGDVMADNAQLLTGR